VTLTCSPDGFPNVLEVPASCETDLVHPDFTVTKECSPKSIVPGQDITWTINLENTGDTGLEVCCNDQTAGISNECRTLPGNGSTATITASRATDASDIPSISNTVNCIGTLTDVDLPNQLPRGDSDTCFVEDEDIPVPTMNEWGMILFVIFAGVGAVYYLRRKRLSS
jgi:hypothetical protein